MSYPESELGALCDIIDLLRGISRELEEINAKLPDRPEPEPPQQEAP
jgi:hypothetical protein